MDPDANDEPRWRRYLRLWGPNVAGDVSDELAFHMEQLVDEYRARGMSEEMARQAASARFGSYTAVEAECRHLGERRMRMTARAGRLDWSLWQDVRFTLRALARAPGFAVATVLVLALGIAATTTIFSVVDSVLLQPLPYAHPERLVLLRETYQYSGGTGTGAVSYPNYVDWRANNHSFVDMAAVTYPSDMTWLASGVPERVTTLKVTANTAAVLGLRPLVGRFFTTAEDTYGGPPAVVLGESLWRTRFGADRGVVAQTMTLDGIPRTIVGVMPNAFVVPAGLTLGAWDPAQLFIPLAADPATAQRGMHGFVAVGRLRPGVDVARAKADMQRIGAALAAAYPAEQAKRGVAADPVPSFGLRRVRPILLALFGASALVLLIACANAGGLFLVRAIGRQREVAIRSALGAGRGRVVRQFLTESVLLSLLAGVLGVALTLVATRGIAVAAAAMLPRPTHVTIDARAVLFLVAITVVVGVLFGLVPALRATAVGLQQGLREGGRGGGAGRARQRVRGTLVVAQIALSLVLLIGATLLMRTVVALVSVDPGMRTDHVVTMHVGTPATIDSTRGIGAQFVQPLLARVRTVSGVRNAAFIDHLPLESSGHNGPFTIEGQQYSDPSEEPLAEIRLVTPGYFATTGIPVRRGRTFTRQDGVNTPPVVLATQNLVDRYFAGKNPIGTRVASSLSSVIGVVGNVRETALDDRGFPILYYDIDQTSAYNPGDLTLVARTAGPPAQVGQEIVRAIRAASPGTLVYGMRTMDQVVRSSVAPRRLYLWVLGSFAAVALLLAVFGIYGLIAYSVAQRRREFGVRIALGSDRRRVSGLVVREGARLVVGGLLIGIPAAALLTRFLAGILYGVVATDVATYAAVAGTLTLVALAASWIPARRAARVEPVVALQSE